MFLAGRLKIFLR